MAQPKRRISRWIIAIVAVVVLIVCAALAFPPLRLRLTGGRAGFIAGAGQAGALKTAQVTSVTAVTSVESSGAVQAEQSASVFWKTTGAVAEVRVKAGDIVKAGDVLMTLDPASAPANVILAQADLVAAQKALDDLLHPSALALANAQKAVADAQDALEKARKELTYAENPAGQNLYDAVADAQLALANAQANLQLSNVSADVEAYRQAVFVTNWYHQRYDEVKAEYDKNPNSLDMQNALKEAENKYLAQLDKQLTLELRIHTDQANKTDAVAKAQDKYDTALANLNAALAGPDATKLAQAQAKVAVAEANLVEAQSKLDELNNGADPNDLASATARLQAAQATVESLAIEAPFDGEVLVVNYRRGDAVSQTLAAALIANRSPLHVDVPIDEIQISQIQVGDEVTVTFDSLPGLTLLGSVAWINPVGSTVQGLVKYTVRVDVAGSDPRVLLGMTANVSIVTDVQAGALAVPLDAVQLDGQGEFVNRVKADGTLERVNVVSGQLQGDLVIVAGDLKPGDTVQVVEPVPTNQGLPFGPG
jgi:HlyD family secretion protein